MSELEDKVRRAANLVEDMVKCIDRDQYRISEVLSACCTVVDMLIESVKDQSDVADACLTAYAQAVVKSGAKYSSKKDLYQLILGADDTTPIPDIDLN